ncbi:MAG: hypothetical protein WC346_05865 [Methanogenium sp.]|jgi:hypothetical protein
MIKPVETFKLTEEHIKLLQHAYVDWWDCDYGAPCIDCKRPYGNSGEMIYKNICEIVGRKLTENQARKLHEELETALQIILVTLSFKSGYYIKEDIYCNRSWKFVK